MSEDIARIRGTRKTYLCSISNQENHILDIISNYSANQQNELNLKAKKNSLAEKIEKVKELDTKILDSLKVEELDNELDQILERNDKFHEILVKIDSCLYSPKQRKVDFHLYQFTLQTIHQTKSKLNFQSSSYLNLTVI